MQYNAPYGISDPNAGYINGNPATGTQGSIPPAASIEFPQREIVALISKSGFTPDNADLTQLAKSVQSSRVMYGTDTGIVNAMTVVCDPPISAYTLGMTLRVQVKFANINDSTHLSLTLNAGAGAGDVRMNDGTLPSTGALKAAGVYDFTWDGTKWQLTNFGGSGTSAPTVTYINIPYVVDTSTIANTIIAPFSPAIPALQAGLAILVKIANSITGPCQITVNTLATVSIRHVDLSVMLKNDLVVGQVALLVYDGTYFQLLSVTGPSASNRIFTTQKNVVGAQNLFKGTFADVTWDAATSAFGTFDGVTFTFTQKGTYVILAGLWISAIISSVDYTHVGGNFIKNGGGLHGYGEVQSFYTGTGGGTWICFGQAVAEMNVGDTLKIQGASTAVTYWTSGQIIGSGETFFDIARIG